jgi:H/ACA ribonucleoprotein complex subunit 2
LCANGGRKRANARAEGGNGRIVENSGREATTDETTGERETAAKAKQVRRGVKEVVKALKKETKGVCVIAGDISPIDVITHVPILCEEAGVPYVYVHSKEELGAAGMTKRPTSVMLVMPEGVKGSVKMSSSDKKEFDDMYEKILAKVKSMK